MNIFTTDSCGRNCSSEFHASRDAYAHPIFDTRISYTARAILLLMHYHPWLLSFTLTDIGLYCDPDRDPEISVRRAIKELEDSRYIFRNARGRFVIPRIVRDLINAASETSAT